MNQPETDYLRAETIGRWLRNMRESAEKTTAECAQVMGVSEEQYVAYEEGVLSPSMPQFEAVAFLLNVLPETLFEEDTAPAPAQVEKPTLDFAKIAELRRRIIGVTVQRFRREAGVTLEQLAEMAGISLNDLERYEFGEVQIPLVDLDAIARYTGHSLRDFLDRRSQLGIWSERQRMLQEILNLPVELRDFISKPVNRPYLELAQRLSEMPTAKLRSIAEGLLEITL
jgi:transcriptional regulator with XRE-family HTH domain